MDKDKALQNVSLLGNDVEDDVDIFLIMKDVYFCGTLQHMSHFHLVVPLRSKNIQSGKKMI